MVDAAPGICHVSLRSFTRESPPNAVSNAVCEGRQLKKDAQSQQCGGRFARPNANSLVHGL
jgi:hypothetical protein